MKNLVKKILLLSLFIINCIGLFQPVFALENEEVDCYSNVDFEILFRLYNPNTGEHFYTSNDDDIDTSERSLCIRAGWRPEDIAWTAATKNNSTTPVYRLYNPNNGGDHHYTQDKQEYESRIKDGWRGEGIAFYSDDKKGIPIYREYNPNAISGIHNWTTSLEEHNYLVSIGWKDEGIAFYAIDSGHDLYGEYAFHDVYTTQSYLLRWVKCKKCHYSRYVQYYYYKPKYAYAIYLTNNYPFKNIYSFNITTWQEFLDVTGF